MPRKNLRGTIRVPGDKSISNRLAMLCGIATGRSRLTGFLESEDCLNALEVMRVLGAGVERDGDAVTIEGTGGVLRQPPNHLEMGNSGTLTRLLAGLLAGFPIVAELRGDASLNSRPMRRIIDPLRMMGVDISAVDGNGRAPLRIAGGAVEAIEYRMPVASAQVKSAILLAGLKAAGTTRVIETSPTRDHTERLLKAWGVGLRADGGVVELDGSAGGPLNLPARDWPVPGDASSGAFWLAAAASLADSAVTVERMGLNPSRSAFLDVLRRMGAEVEIKGLREVDWEPQGDVTVRAGSLKATVIDGLEIPNLIDELPVLAVVAAAAVGTTRIRDAAELRVKESDRIASTAAMLRVCGVEVHERPDGMDIVGRRDLVGGGEIDSCGDHRIAMAGAILGLRAPQPVTVLGAECAAVSYPGFRDTLDNGFDAVDCGTDVYHPDNR